MLQHRCQTKVYDTVTISKFTLSIIPKNFGVHLENKGRGNFIL